MRIFTKLNQSCYPMPATPFIRGFLVMVFFFLGQTKVHVFPGHPLPEPISACVMMPPPDTLPVVVHVIHTGQPVGAPDNPGDSLILAMMQLLNNACQASIPPFGGTAFPFVFALAKRSPECGLTTGIIRMDGSGLPWYTTGGITTDTFSFPNSTHELFVKNLSRWDNTAYVNIWIVNLIDGNPNWPGGYAYFPEYNSALFDGIVLRASVVNGENKTIVHELGHYLSLYHTFGNAWGNCIPESDCQLEGDELCDTEECRYEPDCDITINACTGSPFAIADPGFGYTIMHNYMGYSDCQFMFTTDQVNRMTMALNEYRYGLLTSNGLSTGSGSMPVSACIPVAGNALSEFYGIERVEIGMLNLYSNTSLKDGAIYHDRCCHQSIEVTAGNLVPVRLTGSYENFHQMAIYLDVNNDGLFEEPGELLLQNAGGMIEDTLQIPVQGIEVCQPLRLRVIMDHPLAEFPDPCMVEGDPDEGVGQVEDYAVIIHPRAVESTGSGNWADPSVWSSGAVPAEGDAIRVLAGHTLVIGSANDSAVCATLHLEMGAVVHHQGLLVVGGNNCE